MQTLEKYIIIFISIIYSHFATCINVKVCSKYAYLLMKYLSFLFCLGHWCLKKITLFPFHKVQKTDILDFFYGGELQGKPETFTKFVTSLIVSKTEKNSFDLQCL